MTSDARQATTRVCLISTLSTGRTGTLSRKSRAKFSGRPRPRDATHSWASGMGVSLSMAFARLKAAMVARDKAAAARMYPLLLLAK